MCCYIAAHGETLWSQGTNKCLSNQTVSICRITDFLHCLAWISFAVVRAWIELCYRKLLMAGAGLGSRCVSRLCGAQVLTGACVYGTFDELQARRCSLYQAHQRLSVNGVLI